MHFFSRNFRTNLVPTLLRLLAFVLLFGTVLAQAPTPNAQAAGEPKLILTKSIEGGLANASVGDTIRYRIRLECSSLVDPCGELVITDVLQAGLTYLPPPNSSVPSGFTITEAPAGTITIRKTDNMLLDGSQYDAVIAVKVNYDLRPLPAAINNTINGTIDPPGPTGIQIATPASAPPITIDGLIPNWGLTKTLFSPSINPTVDTDVTYQINLCPASVSGNVSLQNIVITDTLPADAVFVSASNGGTNSSGVVTWNVVGPVTPPACATRYVTIRYPKASFPIGTSITNSATSTATYLDSSGNPCPNCFGITPDNIIHPIDDIFDIPTYGKSDAGDPVGMSGTARFVLNLNTNGTNYPPNNVTLIDNLLPDAGQLEVTGVTSGQWSAAFDYVRAYVEYSTDNGGNWVAFGGVVDYNDNVTYAAPVTNITNVRWRFEYDSDRALPFDVATTQPGLPYTWSFTSNPEVRVKPRIVDAASTNAVPIPLPAAVNGTTYTNCVQVSRVTGDPANPDPVTDACKYEAMTVRGDYVSLRTTKGETPGTPWDSDDPLITTPGFTSDFSILPGDTLKYTITVDMTERSSANLINPTIQDTLPADLIFVRNGTATLDGGAVVQPLFTQVGQNLKWTWDPDLSGPGLTVPKQALGSHLLRVEFFARIPAGQAPGSRTNNLYVVTDSTGVLCEITGTQSTDTGNIDGDGNSAEAACKTTDTYIVERSAALRGEKWIRSVATQNSAVSLSTSATLPVEAFVPAGTCPDGGIVGLAGGGSNRFTRYPCISRAYPENSFINGQFVPPPPAIDPLLDEFEYNLRIFNDGNVGMMRYVLYDILPYYGDKGSGGTLTDIARDSQFRPALRGPVQFISGPGLTAANFTIEYNLTTNPCRPEVFNTTGAVPSGCDNNWTTTWSALARSYRIRLIEGPGVAIPPSTTSSEIRFGVPMSIVADAPLVGAFNSDDPQSYEIAWNSFSHVGSYTDLTSTIRDLLASEPRKVGITIPEMMSIGNRVWRDSDNSGTINAPDDTDPGIAGVIVNLYRDVNNDGIPDGAAIATTTTDAGSVTQKKGYYLFSNIPYDSVTPGNNRYIVGIPAINFGSADPDGAGPLTQGALYTLRSSTGTPAVAKYTTSPLDANVDMEDHGKDPAILNQEVFSPTITLQPNTEAASETDLSDNNRDGIAGARRGVNGEADTDSDLTVDFGFFGGIDIPFSIGNHLWYDNGSGGGTLNDGIRQGVDTTPAGTEPPVIGARVELYRDGDQNGILLPSEMIRFDITDAAGFYLFDNLDPGDYYVLVSPGNFTTSFDPDGAGPLPAAPGVLRGWYSSQPTGTELLGINGGTATADLENDDNGENNNTPEVQGVRSGKVVLERGVNEPLGESPLSSDSSTASGFNPTAGDGTGHIGRFGETDATSNLTIDFGFIPPMSLGNRVWIDDGAGVSANYNNGIMDSGELGVGGVRVELWRDTNATPGSLEVTGPGRDTFIRYVTTDASGYYLFDYIQPSDGLIEPYDYFVHIPAANFVTGGALENYVSSSVTDTFDNADDIDDNGIDSATPMSTGITSPLIEIGYGDEPLTSPTAGFTETDISPNTAVYGVGNVGLFGQTDSNSNLTLDFGFVSPLSLGNRVWRDSDNSGTINAADNTPPLAANPGIAGVTVNLYRDADNNGIPDDLDFSGGFDSTLDRLAFDTTDSGGYYLFSNLGAGNYIVGIPASNFNIGQPLYTLRSSSGTPPVATYTTPVDGNPDQADHGIDPTPTQEVFSPTINLTVGAEPVAESDLSSDVTDGIARRGTHGEQDNNSDLTVDFGFYGVDIPFSIGNHLWKDDGTGAGGVINDGIRQDDEPAVAGARVELYRDGNLDHSITPSEMIRFDVTDSNGFYLFDNLEPGEYYVLVTSSNFVPGGPLEGWYSSQVTTLSESGVDNDDNGIDTNTPEMNGVLSSVIILEQGVSEPVGETFLSGQTEPIDGTSGNFNPTGWDGDSDLLTTGIQGSRGRYGETDATSNLTIDFGFIPPMSLGNHVWIDSGAGVPANYNNGIMDSGELGVSGARVELWRDNGNGTLQMSGTGADTLVGFTTTDSQGYYLFERLQSGSNYFVHIPASNFVTGGALLNYVSSTVTNTTDSNIDIDDNGIDSVTPMSTGITSPLIGMGYGTESVTESDISSNTATYGVGNVGTLGQTNPNSNLTVDFGFISPMSLGNRVWRDSDNSGTINAADDANPGIVKVVVNLYSGVDVLGDGVPDDLTILAADITDANGYYLFGNLPAGNYIVGIPASNFIAVTDPLYALRSSTGTPAAAKYTTAPVDANVDREDHGRDPAAVGGAVYSPIINLSIGAELTSETDLSGNVADDGPASRGVNGETNNNSDLTVDFGFYGGATPFSIGNHLWYDDGQIAPGVFNPLFLNDGIRQSTERPVAGARVELYRDGNTDGIVAPSEMIRFDVTDADGFYLFDNLDPGNYYVLVTSGNFKDTLFDPDGGGTLYTPALGVLRGWYSSQSPNPANAEAGIDNNDDGVDNDSPENSGVLSSVIILTRDTASLSYPEPTGESPLSSDSSMASGFNPTAGDGSGHIGRFGETDATSNVTIDFGFIPPMSLGNRVWIDDGAGVSANYNNGIMDSGELGVGGVRVELWRDTNGPSGTPSGNLEVTGLGRDTFIRYTTTDASGYYLFERLQPGNNYYVHIRASNFTPGGALENYVSSSVTDAADNSDDMDDNGIDNGNIPATNGVTSPGITMAYGTEPLTSGNEIDISSNTTAYGAGNVGIFPGQTDSSSNLTMDFGFVHPPRSIGNYLWFDTGMGSVATTINNGVRDIDSVTPANSEVGVAGARVSLYRDTNGDGIPDDVNGDTLFDVNDALAFDTTDVNGYYLFDNLPAGRYLVGVDGDNFDTGGSYSGLVGYTSSTGYVDNASNNTDSRDNGIDPSNPTAAGSPYGILSTTIDLTAIPLSGLPTGETGSGNAADGAANGYRGNYGETDANSDLTIDFGFVEAYALGNRVWFDTNNDGVMTIDPAHPTDPLFSEIGIAGVEVALYHADASGNPTTAVTANGVARTAVTNADGYYLFDYVAPGDYVVVITADNFNDTGTFNALVGYWSSRTTISAAGAATEVLASTPDPDNDIDLDDNGTRQTSGALNNAVISKAVTLGPTGLTEPTNDDDLQPVIGHGDQPDGRSNLSVDFGFYKTEIGNLVFEDVNVNGTYDAVGDNLITGARVRLYAANNNTEIRVGPDGVLGTTDDNTNGVVTGPLAGVHPTWGAGEYHFSGLPAGDYIVRVTLPATWPGMISTIDNGLPTPDLQNDNNNPDWNVDNNDNGDGVGPVTTTTYVTSETTNRLTMTPGGGTTPAPGAKTNIILSQSTGTTTDNTVDFGFVKSYSLGNRVWFDTNNNGVLDAGEVGVNGVQVQLYRDNTTGGTIGSYDGTDTAIGAPIVTATNGTYGDGYYRFDNLFPGEYIVVILADNFIQNGTNDALVGYWSTGTSLNNVTGMVIESATNFPNNNIDQSDTFGPIDPLYGDENGVTTFNGNKVNYVASTAITLGGEIEPTDDDSPVATSQANEAPDNRSNRTVDFGFYRVEIGDLIFMDNNANGNFETLSDTPINGVVVRLYDGNNHEILVGPDGILGNADDLTGNVVTGPLAIIHPGWANGEYHFTGLPAGSYVVKVETPAGTVSTIDSYNSLDTTTPDTHANDNDNGIGTAGGTVTSSTTNPLVMVPGEFGASITGTTTDLTVDFGFVNAVAIGNRIWFDTGAIAGHTNNGIFDADESGVPDGVVVELYTSAGVRIDVGPDGIRGTADDLSNNVTSANGSYKFDNLWPGTYYVQIPASEFASGRPLYGYLSSTGAGADETTDQTGDENGIDPVSPNTPATNGVRTQNYTLTPGSEQTLEDQTNYAPGTLPDNSVNFTADFGFVQAYSLGNRVWFDTNNDGVMTIDPAHPTDPLFSEIGIDGVQVRLYRADVSGNPTGAILDTSVTANGGYYLFDNLASGDYVVVITADNFDAAGTYNALVGYWSSRTTISAAGVPTELLADTPDPDTGLVAGPADDDLDLDDNGTRTAFAGFVGAVVSKPVTLGPSGNTEPTNDDDLDITLPGSQQGQPDGRANMAVDFGFYRTEIGNLVYQDVNLDGTYLNAPTDGDLPLDGVTVHLYGADNNAAAEIPVGLDGILGTADDNNSGVVTGPNASHLTWGAGEYHFSGLPEGDYIVTVTSPTGMTSTVDTFNAADTGNPDTNIDNNDNGIGETGGIVSSNVTNRLTTNPGSTGAANQNIVDQTRGVTTDPTVDFGFVPAYGLGNRVWFDTNNNGLMDAGEFGIPNVIVDLYAANVAGNPTGSILGTDTTNPSGFYLFDYLFPRDYVVVIRATNFDAGNPLAGYWSSRTTMSGGMPTELLADTPDPDTGLVAGPADDDFDTDDNGTRTTTLAGFSGAVISKAVTLGSDGLLEPTGELAAQLEAVVGQGNQPDNRANMTVDFGFYKVAIGNLVFLDNNVNGTSDGGDAPIQNVIVHLFNGTTEIITGADGILGTADDGWGPNGVLGGGDDGNGGRPTDATGNYLFSGLPAGDYIVKVEAPTGTSSTIDNGSPAMLADNTTPDNHLDNNDNGVGQGTATVSANALTMLGGEVGMFDNTTGITTDTSVDFGFVNAVAIGNVVWFDTGTGTNYNNGILDTGEQPVVGAIVELYNATTNTKVITGPDGMSNSGDEALGDVVTDSNGYYKFDQLVPGNYYVRIPASEFQTGRPLYTFLSSSGSGTSQSADNTADENGMDDVNYLTNGIRTLTYTLTPGSMPLLEGQSNYSGTLLDNSVNFTADFGFVEAYSLGNRVWIDTNKDGIRNDGVELGLGAVTVNLYVDSNDDGTPDGASIANTATDTNGFYRFDNLVAGTYIAEVVPPAGYASTIDAGDPDTDVDDDDDNGVVLVGGNVRSQPVTLGPGGVEPVTENNPATNPESSLGEAPDNRSNRTVDFGFFTITSDTVSEKQLTATTMMDNGPTPGTDYTTTPEVAIGEILTYVARLRIPSNTTLPNLRAFDQMDNGLAFVGCDSISAPNLTTTGSFSGACSNPTIAPQSTPDTYTDASQVTFVLGDVSNNTAQTQVITITYRVIVLDVPGNKDGVGGLNNSITWSWTGVTLPPSQATSVEIVEPKLSIDKSTPYPYAYYGSPVMFSIAIAHTADSSADAFDVIVTDVLPAGLDYVANSAVPAPGSLAPTSTNYNSATRTLTFVWDTFPLGSNSTINFVATFVGPAPVVNSASVIWSSLGIDPQPVSGLPELLSSFNNYATERWYDPLNSTGINSYGTSDLTVMNLLLDSDEKNREPLRWSKLPATGFAPDIITKLPPMPEGFAYAKTDLWLEVQKLGLKMDIVGVPFNKDTHEWNLTWLNAEAGWLENTAFPTHAGNSALTGHTTLPNGKPGPFAKLGTLSYGDQIIVHLSGQKYIFEVRSNKQVKPDSVESTLKHEELPWLTLITCKSYNEKTGEYAYRTVVRAVLLEILDE